MTEIRVIPRGKGKTFLLVQKVVADPTALYVASTERRARFALDMAVEMIEKETGKRVTKLTRESLARRFVGVPGWIDGRQRGMFRGAAHIDDIEDVLEMVFGQLGTLTTSATVTTDYTDTNTEETP